MQNLEDICELALKDIEENEDIYTKERLIQASEHIVTENMDYDQMLEAIMQTSLELTSDMEPRWQFVASKLYTLRLYGRVRTNRNLEKSKNLYKGLYSFIKELTDKGLYGKYILENYSEEEILELENEIKPQRDFIFTYSGINLLATRYLIQDFNRQPIELPQQMFMGIAMHLAIPERKENRIKWAKRFYNVLSSLKSTMATPTMSNARKPFYQLSSCFIDNRVNKGLLF